MDCDLGWRLSPDEVAGFRGAGLSALARVRALLDSWGRGGDADPVALREVREVLGCIKTYSDLLNVIAPPDVGGAEIRLVGEVAELAE